MTSINVDHSQFGVAATKIEDFIRELDTKMMNADQKVQLLSANWEGTDYTMFMTRWKNVMNADSTYKKMRSSLQSYALFLRDAGEKYKTAQANAIDAALLLPL